MVENSFKFKAKNEKMQRFYNKTYAFFCNGTKAYIFFLLKTVHVDVTRRQRPQQQLSRLFPLEYQFQDAFLPL